MMLAQTIQSLTGFFSKSYQSLYLFLPKWFILYLIQGNRNSLGETILSESENICHHIGYQCQENLWQHLFARKSRIFSFHTFNKVINCVVVFLYTIDHKERKTSQKAQVIFKNWVRPCLVRQSVKYWKEIYWCLAESIKCMFQAEGIGLIMHI